MLLSDMGADVIKVENPVGGDDSRAFGPYKKGLSSYYMGLNRGKRGVTLNLKDDRAKEIFKGLVREADVVVENFKPGTMKKLGLDYDVLKEVNPRIIYAASSGFGQTGPYSPRAAYDLIIQGMSGFMSITGFDKEHPVKAGSSIADIMAGVFTAIGILAALEHRRKTGEGQMVDVAMLDCMVAVLENALATYDSTGKSPEPIGNVHRSISPFAAFTTANGQINICAGNDELWRRLCEVIGMEAYTNDPRFADNKARVANFGELAPIMNERLKEKDTEEWLAALEAVKVPCGPILNMEQVVSDPHLAAREMLVNLAHPVVGNLLVANTPIKFSKTPASIEHAAPELGEHNKEVYGELLGLSGEEIDELVKTGAL